MIGRRVALAAVVALSACGPKPAAPVEQPAPTIPVAAAQKLMWILQLEDSRQQALPGVAAPAGVTAAKPDLISLVGDSEAHVRRRAALALGRVRLVEAVAPLMAMLPTEPDPEVRQMVAFALGLIGDPAAAAALTTALSDPNPLVHGRAAEALGLIGHKDAAPAIAAMIAGQVSAGALNGLAADDMGYPKAAGTEAVRLGLYALVRLGAYDALAQAVLENGRPRSRWWPVAFALQRVGDGRAVPALVALLSGEGQVTRAFAIRGLGALKHELSVPALMTIAANAAEPTAVRVQAVRALASIGDARGADVLVRVVTTPKVDPNLQLEAVTALGQLRSGEAVELFVDLASAPWPSMRAAALGALARADPDQFISVISTLDNDPHWSVRAALAGAVAELGRERAEPRLLAMLKDDDRRVLPKVLSALARVRAGNAAGLLADRLQSDDPIVRMAAANGLAELKATGATPALTAALAASAADGTYVARAAILGTLAATDPEAARPALEAALADKDWAVRVRAAELLRAADPGADVSAMRPAPPPAVADLAAVDKLIAPSVSPIAYVDTDKGSFQVELAVIDAPRTAANFIALVRRGFFNNIPLHRLVPDFVAQGGDPRGDGEGGPGYTIRDEINQRPYLRGTVGMALDWADTGGSQFFIVHSPQPHLDARYTVFGQVISGMDVVDRLSQWDAIRTVRVWDGVTWIGGP
jgi:cyclophilin family peptidyl-prolyl cis-trans isomerase/HEAT repeat protein